MTTLRDIFNAFAPEDLARYPTRPTVHRKVISAIHNCRRGHSGYRLYQCQSCGEQHHVNHACGNRHCPQCPPHKTQQWLSHHLEQQLPGPHCLLPFTVPETLRPFIRSHQRLAYHALCTASSAARKRLANDERFIGTDLPGCTGVRHTGGRHLQYHPPIHSIVPGGGLSEDRTTGLPSRANFFVPVKALSPIYRAIFKEAMRQAGLLEPLAPQVWTIPWHVHSQAHHNGHSAFPSLAPYVFRVALSNSRLVSLKDGTVTFSYRKPESARPRVTHLDAMEFLRRFLQHVLPDGFVKVRHFGFQHASCPMHSDTLRLMIVQAHPIVCQPLPIVPPPAVIASCPTWGGQRRIVRRLWTANRACVNTG